MSLIVAKDESFNNVRAANSIVVPIARSLIAFGDNISQLGQIVYSQNDNTFYVHDATTWVPIGGGSGGGDQGFRAKDGAAVITDNAAALVGGDALGSLMGDNSCVGGPNSVSLGNGSIAIGIGSETNSDACIAIGKNAKSLITGLGGNIVLGTGAKTDSGVNSYFNIVIGSNAKNATNSARCVAIGVSSFAGESAVAIGTSANSEIHGIAMGLNASTVDFGTIAIGNTSQAKNNSIAVGQLSYAAGGGVAIGHDTHAEMGSISIGANTATGAVINSVSVGQMIVNKSNSSVAVGVVTEIDEESSDAIAIGSTAHVNSDSDSSIAIGGNTVTTGPGTIALGKSAVSNGIDCVSIGSSASTVDTGTIAIGLNSTGKSNSIAVGQTSYASGGGVAIGHETHAEDGSISIGAVTSTGSITNSVSVGTSIINNSNLTIALGRTVEINTNSLAAIAIGRNAKIVADSIEAIAFGSNTSVTGAGVIALGAGTTNTVVSSTAIGYQTKRQLHAVSSTNATTPGALYGGIQDEVFGVFQNTGSGTPHVVTQSNVGVTVPAEYIHPESMIIINAIFSDIKPVTMPTGAAVFAKFPDARIGDCFIMTIQSQALVTLGEGLETVLDFGVAGCVLEFPEMTTDYFLSYAETIRLRIVFTAVDEYTVYILNSKTPVPEVTSPGAGQLQITTTTNVCAVYAVSTNPATPTLYSSYFIGGFVQTITVPAGNYLVWAIAAGRGQSFYVPVTVS